MRTWRPFFFFLVSQREDRVETIDVCDRHGVVGMVRQDCYGDRATSAVQVRRAGDGTALHTHRTVSCARIVGGRGGFGKAGGGLCSEVFPMTSAMC